MQGYCGQILRVDLTTREISTLELSEEDRRQVLGGSGVGVKLLLDELGSKLSTLDPLAPENPLYFLTGPLAGSNFPGTSRMVVCSKSPLTGIWGESNLGGTAAVYLKSLGYDGLKICGQANEPLVLELGDSGAELTPAGELWGLDSYSVADKYWGDLTGRKKLKAIVLNYKSSPTYNKPLKR